MTDPCKRYVIIGERNIRDTIKIWRVINRGSEGVFVFSDRASKKLREREIRRVVQMYIFQTCIR